MRKYALYAALAAVTMAGAVPMTSEAAVKAYVISGNGNGGMTFGNGNCSKNNSVSSGCGNIGSLVSGNGCSINDILQMITSGNGTNIQLPDYSGASGCPSISGNLWNGNGSCGGNTGSFGCTGNDGCTGNNGCTGNDGCTGNNGCADGSGGIGGSSCPGIQIPDIQLPGNGNPGNGNPGTQIPGTSIPGGGSTGTQKPDIPLPGTGNPGTQVPGQSSGQEKSDAQQVIDLVNEERAKAGLSPVTEDTGASAAAAVRAQEITRSFSHTRPDGRNYSTALDEMGVKYWGNGENIAYGQRNAAEVMNGWMNSQGHRANILNSKYTKIGVACYESSNGVKYWVQLFTY